MALFRFKLSDILIEKLCLVLHVFRENNVPDDVFWYMIKPYGKVEKKDIFIYDNDDKKFVSMFEYGHDLKIKVRDKWNMFEIEFLKNICPSRKLWMFRDGIVKTNKLGNQNVIIQNNADTYTLFSFSNNSFESYLCRIQLDDNFVLNVDNNCVNKIIRNGAILLCKKSHWVRCSQLLNLNQYYLIRQKFNITGFFMDC